MSARELANAVALPRRCRTMETHLRWPIYWSDWQAWLFIPNYNRHHPYMCSNYNAPRVPRHEAIQFALDNWDDYLHLGDIPSTMEREQHSSASTDEARLRVWRQIGEADYVSHAVPTFSVCAAAKAHDAGPIKTWMLDSRATHISYHGPLSHAF